MWERWKLSDIPPVEHSSCCASRGAQVAAAEKQREETKEGGAGATGGGEATKGVEEAAVALLPSSPPEQRAGGATSRVSRAGEAGLGEAVEHAAALTREVSTDAQTVIDADSPLGTALGDERSTAYFFKAQFRELRPGSKQRFLATVQVSSCIIVFASGGGRAFGAHINGAALGLSVLRMQSRWEGATFLEEAWRALQDAFRGVEPSLVTVSLVGGYKQTDLSVQLKETYPDDPSKWSFSSAVRSGVSEALPGAAIDASLLNRFEGSETPEDKERCWGEGQLFQVVALDSFTGKVVSQTNPYRGGRMMYSVPLSVVDDAVRNDHEWTARMGREVAAMIEHRNSLNRVPGSIETECRE